MFGGILILICTLMHVYVLWRITAVPFIKRHLQLRYLILIIIILWAAFFSGLFLWHNHNGSLASVSESIAMTWMAMLFLIFTSIFIADVFTGFGFFIPGYGASIRGWALAAGVLLSLIGLIQGHRAPVTDNFELKIKHLPKNLDGTMIIALADLHAGSQIGNNWLSARVAQVNELKPDLVVLLGDIVEGHGSENQNAFASTLSHLSAPLGVYAVIGNHEYYGSGDEGSVSSVFDKAGIPVLRGAWKELKPGLILAGVDPPQGRMGRRDLVPGSISSALNGRPEGAVILLSHFPQGAEEAAGSGVDLMLSGHTHGGQIWPFNWIERSVYPLREGEYKVNGMPVIVSRGAGTWGPRMRLWKPGEIVRITLHQKDDKDN
jgi:uncharacterized protein